MKSASGPQRPAALFHGTNSTRLELIQKEGRINPAPFGDRHVSMTDCPEVAAYFANLAASADEGSVPIILVIDPAKVDVEPFSSSVWGDGRCDWERELASLKPVALDSITKIERRQPQSLDSFDHLRNCRRPRK